MLQIHVVRQFRLLSISAAITFFFAVLGCSNNAARDSVTRIVSQIQRADYEGNQAAMQKGYDELMPFVESKELASRVRYWRGFAQWRRAINGLNDSVDPKELEQDLKLATDEFKGALAKDPAFVEANIGMISCFGYLAFMNRNDQTRVQEFIGKTLPLVKETKIIARENPRFIWVLGPILWNTPSERGGGQDRAIANYERGLELVGKNESTAGDSLDPSWGKAELMMNLAYSHLNKTNPDVTAAERYAQSALAIVPHWHYVRDILLPQILEAKAKAK
jgi:hypothetical protein